METRRVLLALGLSIFCHLHTIDAFAQPAGSPAAPAAESPADPPPDPVAETPPPEPVEVTVEGDRAPPGSVSFKRRDIRDMPGVLGDPYRAVEVQPGVTPTASGVPYYFIRGAPPGNVGYFFDGIRVPLLFHVGAGPSVIPAAVVERVELHLGPLPADIGRIAGAVIEADGAPPSPGWRAEAALRIIDLGGVIEGPVNEDVSVLAGGHYAAGAAILSALVPSVDVEYGDYQARASGAIGPGERWTALLFGSYDYLATISEQGGVEARDVLIDSDFHRLDLRYERQPSAGGKILAAITLGLDQSRGGGAELARAFQIGARMRVERPLPSGRALLRAGVDVALDAYDITPAPPICPAVGCEPGSIMYAESQLQEAFPVLFPSRLDLATGAWADAVLVIGEGSTITPGLRLDHYASLGNTALAIDPRVVGRFGVGPMLRLVPAVGVASQLPGFAPVPALQIGGIPGGLQRSLQTSFGAELDLGPFNVITTAFRQATFNLTDALGTGRGTTFGAERFLSRSLGDAYGLEIGARGALRRDLFFLASYTLSRATRTSEGRTVPSAYDRTHVAHLALLYDLGGGWKAGVRHVFYSGFPAEEATAGRVLSEHPERTKPFYRLDARLAKRWKVGEGGYLGVVLDVQNATLSKEVFDVRCDESGCTPRTIGPITIPTLAIEAGY